MIFKLLNISIDSIELILDLIFLVISVLIIDLIVDILSIVV